MFGYVKSILPIGNNKALLTIELDLDSAQGVCERVQEALCDISIKLHRQFNKRSKNANSYLWELCGEISKTQYGVSNLDVYRDAILNAGVSAPTRLDLSIYEDVKDSWSERGIGWQVIEIGRDDDKVDCLLFKGSSVYTTEEMSRLLDYIVQQAKDLNVEVLDARELSLLKEGWQ